MPENGRPIPDNAIRDAIHAALWRHPALGRHPAQVREAKYISAFITAPGGRAIAFDKMSAGKQPLWVEASAVPSEGVPGVEHEVYPAHRGRNSNLHNLPGFRDGPLVRFYPGLVEQALAVVEMLTRHDTA